ncbi:ABC transporter permease [Parabacteroides sp. PF5-6]|uniref:ABC transporter permease n=1 Tax=Parabacteroides sp. PF5-6 TaxID=1742403 RepID=UPI0024067476|nr:ABC transporter permease [Parabacteroides sp. PF5-6]MDF9831762.1 putative ABC transport system permease protein [Parabacteroides sp. PF5-6]
MKTLFRNLLSILRRFKMATTLNILGLSIAFAAFMAIMMQLDFDWNFDRSHADADRIYRVETISDEEAYAIISRPLADRFFASSPHIVAGTLSEPSFNREMTFTVVDDPAQNVYKELALRVYPNYGEVFAFEMIEGEAHAMERPQTVLIPQSLAHKLFAGETAIGHQLKSDTETFTVGGVYKDFPRNTLVENNIYQPIEADHLLHEWGDTKFYAYIRVDEPQHSEELVAHFKANFDAASLGSGYSWVADTGLRLTPLTAIHYTTDALYDFYPKTGRQVLWVLSGIALIILLIAGINFTNFSTALAPMRIKSINTQKVMGAGESTLRSAMISEAVAISLFSYLLAIGLVYWFAQSPLHTLVSADLSLSAHPFILLDTGGIALLTGVLAGIYPAFYTTSFSPALVLKGSFGLSAKGRRLRNGLISVQFVASFALIICSLFMYLQSRFMQNSPLGFDKEQLIVADIPLGIQDKKEAITNQLKAFSAISEVTYAEMLFGGFDQYGELGRNFKGESIKFQVIPVDPSFLTALGIPVAEGRNFRKEDEKNNQPSLIFNEKACKSYNIAVGDKIDNMEVIGRIEDIKFASFRTEIIPMAFMIRGTRDFFTADGMDHYAYIKVKAGADMKAVISDIHSTLRSMKPDHLYQIRFFDEVIQGMYENETRLTSLIILFSLIAVFISIVGVFGLVVFDSEYRRKEIGVRKVLGSTIREVLLLFNKTYIRILCICFVVAAPIAWFAVSKWLENFAYKTPLSAWVFLLSFLFVSLITSATVTFQSWRVATANPVDALKAE